MIFWSESYYHHVHFKDMKTRPEKSKNLPKFTLPVSSEAGVKLKRSDTRTNTFNLYAMLPS